MSLYHQDCVTPSRGTPSTPVDQDATNDFWKGLSDEKSPSVFQTLGDEDTDSMSLTREQQVVKEVVIDDVKTAKAPGVILFKDYRKCEEGIKLQIVDNLLEEVIM